MMPDDPQRALDEARDKARRKAMGPPLNQSDTDLEARSKVGPERMAEIEAFVRDAAGQAGVDMLRAARDDG